MKFLLIILIIAFVPENIMSLLHRCPHQKHFHESRLKQNVTFFSVCACEKNNRVYVYCKGFKSEQELSIALNFLREYIIDRITIRKSKSLHLSNGLFKKLHIHKLVFEDVSFETVSLFSSLKGLEFYLEELQFIKCNVTNWIWNKGTQFSFLETLIFFKTNLPSDMSDVFKNFPTKLRTLKINDCYVRELGNEALNKMVYLERIELEENRLVKVSPTIFPNPAKRMKYLSLIGNPIAELPKNMFQNMDRLEFLLLSDIKVSSLSKDTFYPIWNQLEEIYLNNIKINCDCNATWMLLETEASIFRKPFCSTHNKKLEDISYHEICSYRPN